MNIANNKIEDLFSTDITPKASELIAFAKTKNWKLIKTPNAPRKFVDDKGIIRMTLKQGSSRTPGSNLPHVELRNADGKRIGPSGKLVSRKDTANHTPINFDLDN